MRTSVAVGAVALALAACKGDGPTPPPPPGVISLNVGETDTRPASQAATLQVAGGSAGGEFVLVPFYGSQTPSATVALEFAATQVGAAIGPPTPLLAPTNAPLLSRAASSEALSAAARFDVALRRMEREVFGPKLRARRAARSDRRSALNAVTGSAAAVPAVGDAVTLNAARDPACTLPGSSRSGHVVAVSTRAIIVADDNNPAGGFTSDDYVAIAQEFDNLVYPTITANFGVPGDIDLNDGHVVIFYTRAVNELTPAGSDAVVGGFFHPRDLFPKTSTNPDFACASSNVAEMFYMLVPDPTGVVNGNIRRTVDVREGTVGVLAHEFQHLINASRRIYVNDAEDFEDVWLNEGLSHIAEELMFYRASGLAPKQNINLATLRSSTTILNAVNAYQVDNLARYIEYLEAPEQRSPYADDDELATRGATWSLLRYAADRSTTAQQDLWMRLANSKIAGIPNWNAVFGGTFVDQVRDWTVANYTDDVVSTTAAYQQPSWHFRSIIPVLISNTNPPPYPLRTRALSASAPLTLTLRGGTAAYLRFSVAAGQTATITPTSSGSAPPAAMSFTVVRTK